MRVRVRVRVLGGRGRGRGRGKQKKKSQRAVYSERHSTQTDPMRCTLTYLCIFVFLVFILYLIEQEYAKNPHLNKVTQSPKRWNCAVCGGCREGCYRPKKRRTTHSGMAVEVQCQGICDLSAHHTTHTHIALIQLQQKQNCWGVKNFFCFNVFLPFACPLSNSSPVLGETLDSDGYQQGQRHPQWFRWTGFPVVVIRRSIQLYFGGFANIQF